MTNYEIHTKIRTEFIFPAIILAIGLLASFYIVSAQDNEGLAGIEFPIPELGNCDSREACKAYCNNPINIEACVEFAEKHGLMDKNAGERALNMARGFQSQNFSGPGGCKTHEACRTYCESGDNMEECITFAEAHGMMPERELAEARKIMQLMREGRTPGGCNSRAACETYCISHDNFEECATFAVANGLASEKEVGIMKKILTEGGPGGCKSREVCETYCNSGDHMEECLKFAIDNGLVPQEEIEHMREGMARMRAGLSQMPPEVRVCVENALGPDALAQMERGEFAPSPEVGIKMQTCFERFAAQMQIHSQSRFGEGVLPEVAACLKATVGEEVLQQVKSGGAPPSPELADKMRACFEAHGGAGGPPSGGSTQMPPGVAACLEGRLGRSVVDAIKSGAMPPDTDPNPLRQAMQACFETPSPVDSHMFGPRGEDFRPPAGSFQSSNRTPTECLVKVLGEEAATRAERGEYTPPPEDQEKILACLAGN